MDENNQGYRIPLNNKRNRNDEKEDGDQQIVKKTVAQQQKISPIEQFGFIKHLMHKNKDDVEYMLARPWYVHWEGFCMDLNRVPPGGIDNSSLLLKDGSLRPHIEFDKDYLLVPERGWNHLVRWYGLIDASFSIVKKRVKAPVQNISKPRRTPMLPFSEKRPKQQPLLERKPSPKIEYNNLRIKLYRVGTSIERSHSFVISPNSTVSEFQSRLLYALKLTLGTEIEIWLLNNDLFTSFSESFSISKDLISDANYSEFIDSSTINFDSTISDCLSSMTPPCFTIKQDQKYYHFAVDFFKKQNSSFSSVKTTFHPLGLCGLQNLGNTCYMNSALQCLSNTPQLTEWFLNQNYKNDINISNPLGLNGELAESFVDIIKSIWNNHSSIKPSISPKEFKNTFERFNPHFVGFQQQDSQELLSFLLDGLHEDLNRILDKPYIEIPDFDDILSDKEIATCFWNYHKARNDSIIVDLFQGQFKSRLTCDECKKVSVTFDPFMYLSLPLPADTKCEIDIVYVPYLPSQRQLKMTIQLAKDAKIGNLKQEIENNIISFSNNHSLLVVEIHQGKIFKLFSDIDRVYTIRSSDTIYVYQLPCPSTAKNDDEWVIFPVYCSTTIDVKQQLISADQFGFPIVLAIEAKNLGSLDDLYGTIVHHIERYCIVKLFEEDTYYIEIDKEKADKKEEEDLEDLLLPHYQQPIHTTAAVTPAGGGPMVPMPNLFNIKVFSQQKNSASYSKSRLNFPTGDQVHWHADRDDDTIFLEQGQGILIEWSTSKAQQVFGSNTLGSGISIYEHDYDSDINTEAWREYEELISNTTTNKSSMTTRSSTLSSAPASTLEDCLNEFTGDESLSNDDLWYCPRCKKHQRASKKFDIWKLPEILVVHLKRFSQVRRWGNKIDTFIDFPISGLDMTDRVLSSSNNGQPMEDGDDNRLIYDLYAVDNHYGGMGGGHYTAYAQNIQNKCWYNFDDSHVNQIELKDIKSSAAYLLFYKRRR